MGFLENFEYIFFARIFFHCSFHWQGLQKAYKYCQAPVICIVFARLCALVSPPVARSSGIPPPSQLPCFRGIHCSGPSPSPQKRRATSDSLLWISVCGTTYLISSSFCSYQPLTTSIAIEFYVGHHLCHRPKNFSLLLRLLLLRGDISIAVSLRFQSIRLPLTHTVKTLSPLIS